MAADRAPANTVVLTSAVLRPSPRVARALKRPHTRHAPLTWISRANVDPWHCRLVWCDRLTASCVGRTFEGTRRMWSRRTR